MIVSIKGLNKVKVLKELWTYAIVHECYRKYAIAQPRWNKELAKDAIKKGNKIDLFQGRYICCDLSNDTFDTCEYDLHNRFMKAEKIIKLIYKKNKVIT